ncbi:cytochrome c oxidase subunit II [Aquimarina sp. AD10]|uniref:cytochrome c oxidase subunit II n=1 Tax=Aquimarina sp. AD10 TaxID=1714849 RepID=UPI000E54DCDF|nr:cytochrome c oxidase subunit II [Aquimarina sp. AD10]AXT61214.1 cytochrome c oxidase subunit II [Aquimarina sp. AD10]RKN02169.1 cytochrome c oxidase subunit II [Aquimarina sp. AD10]
MSVFLTIVVIALFGITLWQMSRILKLSQLKNADNSQVANDKDNNLQGKLMLAFVIFMYLLTLYCFVQYHTFFLPESASEHGVDYDQLMFISMVLIFIVQFLTQGLLHYFAYKYRGKKGNQALFFADNDKLEFIWTIIPVIVLAGLIIYGLFTWTDIMNIDEEEGDPLIVELYAYQFDWRARYAGSDNELGKANVRFIEGINTLGIDVADNYGKDDKITTELHLPVNRKVIFKMRSQDVLHSAYMPFFRAQMNVVPGMITEFSYTPTMTSEEMKNSDFMVEKVATINKIRKEKSKKLVAKGDEALETYEFEYYLLCNKICGASHYNMQMKIVVESEKDYEAWLKTQPTFGEQLSAQASN